MIHQTTPAKWPKKFALVVLLLSVIWCAWSISNFNSMRDDVDILYWPKIVNFDLVFLSLAALGLSLLILMIVRVNWKFPTLILLGAIFFSVAGVFLWFSVGNLAHVGSVTMNGHEYHLALKQDEQWDEFTLCQCDASGLFCRCHTFYGIYRSLPSTAQLFVDGTTNELKVKVDENVVYVYGNPSKCYKFDGVCYQ
jgi:hypothetical protein